MSSVTGCHINERLLTTNDYTPLFQNIFKVYRDMNQYRGHANAPMQALLNRNTYNYELTKERTINRYIDMFYFLIKLMLVPPKSPTDSKRVLASKENYKYFEHHKMINILPI